MEALVSPTKAGSKAYENDVPKEVSESLEKMRMKPDDVHVESQARHEAPVSAAKLVNQMGDQHVDRRSFPQLINPQSYVDLSENSCSLSNEHVVIQMEHNTCQFNDNMEAFYAALHAETYAPPSPLSLRDTRDDSELAYPQMSEESKKALEILKELLSKQFCYLLDSTSSTSMKTTLEYLCTLFADDDEVSLSLKSLILQLSAELPQWSWVYTDASMKLESSSSGLLRLDTVEEGLVTNKNQFSEFVSIEKELCSQLADLEQRKKELEEKINAIKANISMSAVARDSALRKKSETYVEGRVLKAQRDELRKRKPTLIAEKESAKAIKASIEDEWSKIREKFDRILNTFGLDY